MLRRLPLQSYRLDRVPKAPCAWTGRPPAAMPLTSPRAASAVTRAKREASASIAAEGADRTSHVASERPTSHPGRDEELCSRITATASLATLADITQHLHQSHISARVSGSIAVQALKLLLLDWPDHDDTPAAPAGNTSQPQTPAGSFPQPSTTVEEDAAAVAQQANFQAAVAAAEAVVVAAQRAAAAAAALMAAAHEAAQAAQAAVSASSALAEATSTATSATKATAIAANASQHAASKMAELAAAVQATAAQVRAQQTATPLPPSASVRKDAAPAAQHAPAISMQDFVAVQSLLQQCLAQLLADGLLEPLAVPLRRNDQASCLVNERSRSHTLRICAVALALVEVQSRLPDASAQLQLCPSTQLNMLGAAAQPLAAFIEEVSEGQQHRRQLARDLLQALELTPVGGSAGEGDALAELVPAGKKRITKVGRGGKEATQLTAASGQQAPPQPGTPVLECASASASYVDAALLSSAATQVPTDVPLPSMHGTSLQELEQQLPSRTSPADAEGETSPSLSGGHRGQQQGVQEAEQQQPPCSSLSQIPTEGQQQDLLQPQEQVTSNDGQQESLQRQRVRRLQQMAAMFAALSLFGANYEAEHLQGEGLLSFREALELNNALKLLDTWTDSLNQASDRRKLLEDWLGLSEDSAARSVTDPLVIKIIETFLQAVFCVKRPPPTDSTTPGPQAGSQASLGILMRKGAVLFLSQGTYVNFGIGIVELFRLRFGEEQWQQLLVQSCPDCPVWLRLPLTDRLELCSRAASLPSLADAVLLAKEVHEEQYAHDRKLLDALAAWEFEESRWAEVQADQEPAKSLPPGRHVKSQKASHKAQVQRALAEDAVTLLHRQIIFEFSVLRPSNRFPNRASFVLNEALQRHLGSRATESPASIGTRISDSSSSSRGSKATSQFILEQLPGWLLKLQFWPSYSTCKLLARTLGSAALLAAIPKSQPNTDEGVTVLSFLGITTTAGLLEPESCGMSPDDVSRWLRRVAEYELGATNLLNKMAQAGSRKGILDATSGVGFSDPLGAVPGLKGSALQEALVEQMLDLLTTVDPSSGDLAAVVEVCLGVAQDLFKMSSGPSQLGTLRVQLLEQAAPNLLLVKPSEQPALLRMFLLTAGGWLPRSPDAFLAAVQVVPDGVVSHVASTGWDTPDSDHKAFRDTPQGESLESAIAAAVTQQLAKLKSKQPSGEEAEALLRVAASLVQLPLTRGGILVPLRSFEGVAKAALRHGQHPLALQVLTTLFTAGHRALRPYDTLSPMVMRGIVHHAPAVSADPTHLSLPSLLKAASPLGPQHRSLLLQGLLAASAQERSSAWASAAAAEALSECFTPALVSDLITAFIQPAGREGSMSNHSDNQQLQRSSDEGTQAAVRAFRALLQSPGGSAAEKVSSMTHPAREAMATWLLQQGGAQDSVGDRVAAGEGMVDAIPLILVLDLHPTAAMVRQLLAHPAASFSAADLRRVIALAAEGQWEGQGLGLGMMQRLHTAPHLKQEVLHDGNVFTLACLLVGDAGSDKQAQAVQPSSLSLMLGLLEERVVGAAEGARKAAPEGATRVPLSRAEWQQLLVAVLDLSDASKDQEAESAAAALVQMVQAALPVDPTLSRGGAKMQQLSSAAPLTTAVWLVQECLLAKGALRRPASLALAQRLLQDLSSQGWGVLGGQQTTQQSFKLGVDLLLWMGSKEAVRGGVTATRAGSGKGPAHTLSWLPALVSDLTVHLAAAEEGWVARLAGDAQSLLFIGQACADHGAQSPLVDLMAAAVANKSIKAKVPNELVGKAVEAAAALYRWREGSVLLEHLGVDLKSWRSQQGATRCCETMGQLSAAQAQAALNVLVQDAPSYAIEGPLNNAKSFAAVCGYCEEELLPRSNDQQGPHPPLSLLLRVRGAAAAAANEYVIELSGKAADSLPQELDPDWHCREAERAVRQQSPARKAGGTAQPPPSVEVEALVQLLGVFDAARRPLHALHLGVEVAQGVLAVTPSPSGADGTRVVAVSMGVCTRCGYSKGSVVLLEELLTAWGEVTDTQVMAQAMAAISSAGEPEGDELVQRIVAAVGDDGYFAFEEGASSAGSDSSGMVAPGSSEGLCVRADLAWLKERRALTVQQRQEVWGLP